jgi:hypothetical protein
MPEFYEHLNPVPFEAAAQVEKVWPKIYVRRGTPSRGNVTNYRCVICRLNRKPAANASRSRTGGPSQRSIAAYDLAKAVRFS